ncbi:hypothetical protein GALMADRAFT_241992 [Galerina marginata CBS 339.88]|uniref:NACHT domain-containing protein n=1 Tax=Galerina marginata (strain CBS 339.88) TaxID=685588 RepID=A0A067TLQ5_GALM3|nr:hypothetical protein GALMADRAFT_241992 [Galerina marginata CBS 339.88]
MSTVVDQGFFARSDVLIQGGAFTQVAGDVNNYQIHNHNHDSEPGLRALRKSIVVGALHDASERFPPPKCHPETRKKILALIMAWIEDPTHLEDILWLYGSLGSGKTAIMQTIAELCRSSNNILGGTFFFSRGKPGREDSRLLFATIAYQLALHDPGLRQYINRAMVKDPTLDTKEISKQLKALIIEPFRKLALPRSQIYFVIIDGLDECQGFEIQRQILTLIAKTLAEANIPLRFIITSRPEAHLNEAFRQESLGCRTRRISLDSSSFNPERDIRLFLKDGFDTIAKRNGDVIARIEAPWPTESDIDRLVEKSSGQFIYPATVLKFIGAELHHPVRQLAIVLKPAPVSSTSTLYTNIDQLYTQILNTCPYPGPLARILAVLLVLHCPQPPEVYEEILGVDEGDVTMTLRGLHSLVRFPNPEEDKRERREFNLRNEYDQTRGLRLHHASFRDFLLDEHRCPKEFIVALDIAHGQVAQSAFKLATDWISSPWRDKTDSKPPHRETWGYLKHHMNYHLDQCQSSNRKAIIEDLNDFSVDFPAKARSEEKIWDHAFAAIHSLVTTFAMAVSSHGNTAKHHHHNRANFQSEHSHWAQEVTLDSPSFSDKQCDPWDIIDLHIKYRSMLDAFYKSALSLSDEFLPLLNKLPGFVTEKKPVLFDSLEAVFGVDIKEISTTMIKYQKFIHRWDTGFWNRYYYFPGQDPANVILLNPHLSGFLCNPDRAGEFYLDPNTRRLLDLRQIVSLTFRSDWLEVPRQRKALVYLDELLRSCLDSVTIDPQEDYPTNHPVLGLMAVLKNIVYDIPCLETAPVLNVELIWSTTRRLLWWIHDQISKISGSKDERHGFKKQLIDISNQIYHQILEVEVSEGGRKTITLRKPFLAALPLSSVTVEPGSPSSPPPSKSDAIRISETLLALHGVRASLLSFLTKPDRAGEMHIAVGIYHSQFAELCLDYCDPSFSITNDWKTVPAHTEWRFHLVRATPSAKILAKLRFLRQGPWLAEGLPTIDSAAKVRSFKAVISWLGEIPKIPTDIHRHWQDELAAFERFRRMKPVLLRVPPRLASDNSAISTNPPSP